MYKFIRPLLFHINPETTHHLVLETLAAMPAVARLAAPPVRPHPTLGQTLWGMHFSHPIGLAAGLDKNAQAVDGLFECGFSFVEVGTVTPQPQPGNPLPRLFRLPADEALINRMGFNNAGVQHLCRNLTDRHSHGIVGINIGKNKVTPNDSALDDYLECLDVALPYADYLVLNVSSPNTPGLRDLQSEESLLPLVDAVLARKAEHAIVDPELARIPVLVKLAPDLADDGILALGRRLLDLGIDGFIATNTTISRLGLSSPTASEVGGLSGRPLAHRATEVVRLLYSITRGKIPIIASGGVMTPEDAWNKIQAGANLVQVYTGFIYHGPRIVHDIVTDLNQRANEGAFAHIQTAVGSAT